MTRETVLQFGTGNFLRAFADDFLDRMRTAGLYDGRAVIVSPTDSKQVEKLNARGCRYTLLLRGIENGETVSESREIQSVSRAINPYRDFDAFLELARNPDLRVIISNTTEAGIAFDPACRFEDRPPASFPAKLTRFLYERFSLGLQGFLILPCELIDDNAGALVSCVERYAALWALPEAFSAWLAEENDFCGTLVDRIVTGYPADAPADADPLLDAAEPYHLWVIEGDHEAEFPLKAAGINAIWTADVSPYKKMKVRVLNGLHTSMVFPGMLAGLETVADCMEDPQLLAYLTRLLQRQILPTLPDSDDVRAFADAVAQRFRNPYLRHRLQSISLNSVSKYRARVLPTLLERTAAEGKTPRAFILSLSALIYWYKTAETVPDDPAVVQKLRGEPIGALLRDTALWGTDLGALAADVLFCTELIKNSGIREAIAWSVS